MADVRSELVRRLLIQVQDATSALDALFDEDHPTAEHELQELRTGLTSVSDWLGVDLGDPRPGAALMKALDGGPLVGPPSRAWMSEGQSQELTDSVVRDLG